MHSLSSLLIAPVGGLAILSAMWLASSVQAESFTLGFLAIGILAAAALTHVVACCHRVAIRTTHNFGKKRTEGDSFHGR